MSKYLKLFQTHTTYNTYIGSNNKILPNVSYCEEEDEVHYNQIQPNNVIKYKAPSKLSETTSTKSAGLHTNGFGDATILSHTFENGIGTITFDKDVTVLQGSFVASNITEVYLPDSITTFSSAYITGDTPYGPFKSCTSLTSITIPNNVTFIDNFSFNSCTSLTSVTFGNSVTSIGDYAFGGCTSLTSVHISDLAAWCNISFNNGPSNPLLNAHHLYLNGEEIKDLVIPDGVTSISKNAFYDCSGLTSVTIPNSVTSIGSYAFRDCIGLTSVTIGNNVTSIGAEAFCGCSLTSIIIPDSMASIGNAAFSSCVNLVSITSLATTAPTIQSNTFYEIKTYGTLIVPSSSSGYDVWMGTNDYYLGKYNWTLVEDNNL